MTVRPGVAMRRLMNRAAVRLTAHRVMTARRVIAVRRGIGRAVNGGGAAGEWAGKGGHMARP